MLCHKGFAFYSFYNAWKTLSLKSDNEQINEYTIPSIVNGAFASELALKYILSVEKINYKKTHLLHELFNLLPQSKKTNIWNVLKKNYPMYSDEQLKLLVISISNSFEDFRYFYEHDLVIDWYFCKVFFNAIFEQALSYPKYRLVKVESNEELENKFNRIEKKAQEEIFSRIKRKEKRYR